MDPWDTVGLCKQSTGPDTGIELSTDGKGLVKATGPLHTVWCKGKKQTKVPTVYFAKFDVYLWIYMYTGAVIGIYFRGFFNCLFYSRCCLHQDVSYSHRHCLHPVGIVNVPIYNQVYIAWNSTDRPQGVCSKQCILMFMETASESFHVQECTPS